MPAAAPPELLAAVADADERVTPTLDDDARAPMHAALLALRAALDAGDTTGARRAVTAVRALVATHAATDADLADVEAIALLVAAAESALDHREVR